MVRGKTGKAMSGRALVAVKESDFQEIKYSKRERIEGTCV
jgi:hypothetical protein